MFRKRRSAWRYIGGPATRASVAAPPGLTVSAVGLTLVWCRPCGNSFHGLGPLTNFGRTLFGDLLAFDDCVCHLLGKQAYRPEGIIVPWDNVVYPVRVAIGVHNRDNRYVQLVRLVYRYLFLVGVDDKDDIRKPYHIADSGKVFLQGAVLMVEFEPFLFRKLIEPPVGSHRFYVLHMLNRFLNRLEIRQQAPQPAMINVIVTAPFCFFFHGILCLALGSNKQEGLAIDRLLVHELHRFFEQPLGLLKIYDVNAVALSEDIVLHLRVPPPDLVSKMDAGFKQFLHRYCSQSILLTDELVCVLADPRSAIPAAP